MLLETLVWDCFASRSTLSDGGLTAIVHAPETDVTVALRLDTGAFRRAMDLENEPVCDGLFVGLKRPDNKEPVVHCLFVELKGRNYEHAVKQIETTIQAFRGHLTKRLPVTTFGRTKVSAVIVSDRASPQRSVSNEDIRRFQKEYKSPLRVCYGERASAERRAPPVDLSEHLWRSWKREAPPAPAVAP
jgi:hypothetical protein